MKNWCVQVPVVDFGQQERLKKGNPDEVEVVYGVFEVVYLEILPNHLEVQFPQPVLVFAKVFHFWSNPKRQEGLNK